ncbi:MAG: hypothetical protein ACOYLQ_02825 [Hyphomicrobiaceae bacterium]
MNLLRIAAVLAALLPAAVKADEAVVEIPSRRQLVRTLVGKPSGTPAASLVLLAGGHGNLAIAKGGAIGWGAKNQVVRTRSNYVGAGFVTAVPDVAPDLKDGEGGKSGYRWSESHAKDLGAVVKHLRSFGKPVYIVGTSRAALSVANAAARLTGEEAPDAIVITSGMIAHFDDKHPSAQRNVGNLGRIKQPVLIVYHEKDGCAYTPASSAEPARKLFTGARKVDVQLLKGGSAGSGDPCQAMSHHGFLGMDGDVVKTIATWLKAL